MQVKFSFRRIKKDGKFEARNINITHNVLHFDAEDITHKRYIINTIAHKVTSNIASAGNNVKKKSKVC